MQQNKGNQILYQKGNKILYQKVNALILDGYTNIKAAKGQKGVLMFGNTNSGKSTLINYLIGCRMEKTKLNGSQIIQIEPKELEKLKQEKKRYAQIGHNTTISETIYPEGYYNEQDDFCLCDLAGFGDTRSEERICSVILTEIAVKSLNSIHSIVVVISFSELQASRGAKFLDLCEILANLLQKVDDKGLQESIIFVFTKPQENQTREDIKEVIKHIIIEYKQKLKITDEQYNQLEKNIQFSFFGKIKQQGAKLMEVAKQIFVEQPEEKVKEFEKIEEIIKFLEFILKCQVFVPDFTKPDSRKEIMNALKKSKAIPPAQVEMKYYDDTTRNAFQDQVFEIADEGQKLIEEKIKLDKVQLSQEINFCLLESASVLTSTLEKMEKEKFKKTILEGLEKQKQATIKEKNEEKEKIQQQISDLDKDEPRIFWQKSFKGSWSFYQQFRRSIGLDCSIERTEFVYEGPEIDHVNTAKTNGEFVQPSQNNQEGKYSNKFQYLSGIGATALVQVFVKKKHLPDNQKLIVDLKKKQIELELGILKLQIEDHDEEIGLIMFIRKLVERIIFESYLIYISFIKT